MSASRACYAAPETPSPLYVAGGLARLSELTDRPVVAIVGAPRASDYGLEMAAGIARGLASSGVTVAAVLADGVTAAALAGAAQAGAGAVAVMVGGIDVSRPARLRSHYERVLTSGCAVAQLPCTSSGRRWGRMAAERVAGMLADVTVVVESAAEPHSLPAVAAAQALGRRVAAVPGRVTSPLSAAAHALIGGGAPLIAGPADVLDVLAAADAPNAPIERPAAAVPVELTMRLRRVLELVGSGHDTPDRLTAQGYPPGSVLLALSELELMGLLARGDGGRYLPRQVPAIG